MLKYSLNTIKNQKTNIISFIPKKNFRDYRESRHIVGDNYQAGKRPNPYKPQFTLSEHEHKGKILNSTLIQIQ